MDNEHLARLLGCEADEREILAEIGRLKEAAGERPAFDMEWLNVEAVNWVSGPAGIPFLWITTRAGVSEVGHQHQGGPMQTELREYPRRELTLILESRDQAREMVAILTRYIESE